MGLWDVGGGHRPCFPPCSPSSAPCPYLAGVGAAGQDAHTHHAWGQLVCQQLVAHSLVDQSDLSFLQDGGSTACQDRGRGSGSQGLCWL